MMKRELCSHCGRRAFFDDAWSVFFRARDMCHVTCTDCPLYAPGRGAFVPLRMVMP
jgi:hypothetical protein